MAIVRDRFDKNVKKFVSVTLDRIAGGLIDSARINTQNAPTRPINRCGRPKRRQPL